MDEPLASIEAAGMAALLGVRMDGEKDDSTAGEWAALSALMSGAERVV